MTSSSSNLLALYERSLRDWKDMVVSEQAGKRVTAERIRAKEQMMTSPASGWGINSFLEPHDDILDQPVSELMSPNAITTTEGSTVAELSKAMVSQRIHRLLVVREKEVVGIVSVGDILKAIAEQAK